MKGLILVDIQQGFEDESYWGGDRNNPNAEQNCSLILQEFRKLNLPVIHVKHNSTNSKSPLRKGLSGNAIHPNVAPIEGEPVLEKSTNSAFIGTGLEDLLESLGITDLIVAGLTTEHCISSTVRMAADLGFNPTVVKDATATFAKVYDGKKIPSEVVHDANLASLENEFAIILSTKEVLEELQSQKI